jgi:cell wall-associated NlpC family hydrolase
LACRALYPTYLRCLAVLVATGALFAVLPGLPGTAAPPPSPAAVRARLAALTLQEEQVTEQFDGSRVALVAARRGLARLDARLRVVAAEAAAARGTLGRLAAAAYESGQGLITDVGLLGSSGPQELADRADDLQLLARVQSAAAQRVGSDLRTLRAARVAAEASLRRERGLAATLAAERGWIVGTISAEQATLAQLTAAQQPVVSQSAPSQSTPVAFSPPAVSGAAAVAVRFAYAQLGKPYQWGAAGPDAYDCSGLAMAAWGAAGVSLPHSAADQQSMVAPVPAGDLQPGDLIFFGYPAYHVGIYIGSAEMIDAPHSGTVVRIDPISGYTDAGRP